MIKKAIVYQHYQASKTENAVKDYQHYPRGKHNERMIP